MKLISKNYLLELVLINNPFTTALLVSAVYLNNTTILLNLTALYPNITLI